MKRTTVILNDTLLGQVKSLALKRRVSFKDQLHLLVEEGLRNIRTASQEQFKLELPIVKGVRPPAVDLADRRKLYSILFER